MERRQRDSTLWFLFSLRRVLFFSPFLLSLPIQLTAQERRKDPDLVGREEERDGGEGRGHLNLI